MASSDDTIHREPYPDAPSEVPAIVVHEGMPLANYSGAALRQFIDPVVVEAAILHVGFTLVDEIALYAEIAKSANVAPATRISAAKAIHEIAVKAMILSGDLVSIRDVRTSEDGTHTVHGMAQLVRRVQTQTSTPPKELPNGRTPSPSDSAPGAGPGHTSLVADADGFHHRAPNAVGPHQGLAGPAEIEAEAEVIDEAEDGNRQGQDEAGPLEPR